MDIPALFERMLVLFLILLAGFVCGKTGVMNVESNKALSRLIANLTNPMLVLSSVMTGQRLMTNREVLLLSLIAAGCYAFLIATSFLVPKLLRLKESERGLYRFMYMFSNTAFIGYPLIRALFGDGAMFHLTIFVLFFQLVCWSYGVQVASGEPHFHFYWGILKTPCVAAALAAYVLYLTGVQVPALLSEPVKMIGEVTSPLAMLIIGCALSQCPAKTIFGQPKIYALAALKLIVVPVTGYLILRLFVHDPLLLAVTVTVLAMPVATNATIISYQYHVDDRLAAAGVFLTTLLSGVTLPLLMTVLFG